MNSIERFKKELDALGELTDLFPKDEAILLIAHEIMAASMDSAVMEDWINFLNNMDIPNE